MRFLSSSPPFVLASEGTKPMACDPPAFVEGSGSLRSGSAPLSRYGRFPSFEWPNGWLALPTFVVLLSWLDWAPREPTAFGRAGPYWAGAATAGATLMAVWQHFFRPGHARIAAALNPALGLGRPILAALAVLGCWIGAALFATQPLPALLQVGRVTLFFVFLALTWSVVLAYGVEHVRRPLAWGALMIVGVQVALVVAGVASERVRAVIFEQSGHHTLAGGVWRFRGLMSQPMACGGATLLTSGLLAGLPRRDLRRAAIACALAVVALTMSFATLVLPLVAAGTVIRRGKVRTVLMTILVIGALAALWVNPLRVDLADHTLIDRPFTPAYLRNNLGPLHMPMHTVDLPGLRFRFHFTGYGLLFYRSVTCALQHPLGVGGRNFAAACPVMAMNTLGSWSSTRSAHNSFGALLAEGGIQTTAATLLLVLLLVCRFRFRPEARVQAAIVLGYLFAGFGGASPYQFPLAAILGTSVQLRDATHPYRNKQRQATTARPSA